MAETVTVVKAKNAGEKENPHGGTLTKWYLTVKREDESLLADVYCQKKPTNPLSEGDEVYGRLEKGEFGWRLFPEQNPNGGPSRSNGFSGGSQGKDDYWAKREQRDVESQARQGRAHAQEMSLRLWAIQAAAGGKAPQRPEELVEVIDWFHADVQRFPVDAEFKAAVQSVNDAVSAPESAPPTIPSAPEPPSSPQKSKITQLLNKNVAMEHHADLKAQATSKKDATELISRLIKVDGGERDVNALLKSYGITPQSDLPWSDD